MPQAWIRKTFQRMHVQGAGAGPFNLADVQPSHKGSIGFLRARFGDPGAIEFRPATGFWTVPILLRPRWNLLRQQEGNPQNLGDIGSEVSAVHEAIELELQTLVSEFLVG